MYLLDTNVVSELRKVKSGKADSNLVSWAQGISEQASFVSVITILELEAGVLRKEAEGGHDGEKLRAWLNNTIIAGFSERIIGIDISIAQAAARIQLQRTRPVHDVLIAATAMVKGLIVVTRNTKDFTGIGLSLINPWDI
ncbi:MAG: hypothetical protein RIR97_183 [Pseudomonadota bacterium]